MKKSALPKSVNQVVPNEVIPCQNLMDYSDYAVEPPSDALQQITALADKQNLLEEELAELQDQVAKKARELEDVKVGQLPGLMKSVGLDNFQTTSGLVVTINEGLHCSIPKARYAEAIKWLDDNGLDKLVKRMFVINFNREDQAWANKFKRDLLKRKRPLNSKEEHTVHPQTLKSQIKGILEEGKLALPLDLFGVFYRPESKIDHKTTKTKKNKEE